MRADKFRNGIVTAVFRGGTGIYQERQAMATSDIADKVVVITGASSGIGKARQNFWPDTERKSC